MINYGSTPFPEQLAYFQGKLHLLPTQHWYDVQRELHDAGFMVAGAMKADLLADIKNAMEKAHAQGTTLAQFRKDIYQTAQKLGWTKGWENEANVKNKSYLAWRTRVVYETNLRASYQAGRWQQIQESKKTRPYLIYKHSHAVLHPRDKDPENHLKWNNLVVPVDSKWVKTHYPPKGFGCKCTMFSLSEREMHKLGKLLPDEPPPDTFYHWKNPTTGEVHKLPEGVTYGFDYVPGDLFIAPLQRAVERKLTTLPQDIATQLFDAVQATGRVLKWIGEDKALIKSAEAVTATVTETYLGIGKLDYAGVEVIANAVTPALQEIKKRGLPLPDNILVNKEKFIAWAEKEGFNPEDIAASFVPNVSHTKTYLLLNPLSKSWSDMQSDVNRNFSTGYWSTNNQHHAIYHEMGHFMHYRQSKQVYLALISSKFKPDDLLIAEKVSSYAKTSPAEFVAEVFAKLLNGDSVSDDVITLYEKLKGYKP
jgi:hypothetical protein